MYFDDRNKDIDELFYNRLGRIAALVWLVGLGFGIAFACSVAMALRVYRFGYAENASGLAFAFVFMSYHIGLICFVLLSTLPIRISNTGICLSIWGRSIRFLRWDQVRRIEVITKYNSRTKKSKTLLRVIGISRYIKIFDDMPDRNKLVSVLNIFVKMYNIPIRKIDRSNGREVFTDDRSLLS